MNSLSSRTEPDITAHADGHDPERPSKSQRKRDMHALQALGVELVELPKDALARMPMPESLADAVREARRITDHEGRRRQIQYVGRVMRTLHDPETAALRAALERVNGASRAETAQLHALERLRERLLADDAALTEFMHRYPHADVQQGRTLIRNARREAQQNKPPRYFRQLFQWLKAASDAPDTSDAPDARNAGTTDQEVSS